MKRPLVSILMPVFNGEAVVQLFASWQMRDAEQMPTAGKSLPAAVRSKWVNGLSQTPGGLGVSEAMLRLEMTADVPTPAEYLPARRQLQLQLLTQRNAATPAQTWGDDVATVLTQIHNETQARRLQAILVKLLRA